MEEIKTVLNLKNELDYKSGEVVTKNVVSNRNGSVTLLAFDRGAMLARHQVPCDVCVYVIEGAVEFEIDDTRQRIPAGDAIVMPAGTPHTVLGLERSRVLLTRINA